MSYAGFWKRFAAFVIDLIIIFTLDVISWLLLGFQYSDWTGSAKDTGTLVGVLIAWIYFATFESSAKQATLGKMALRIKVTDMEGNRIGFGTATWRYFGRIISAGIFFIGYIMVAFTKKKQGLHDLIAGCLVVNK